MKLLVASRDGIKVSHRSLFQPPPAPERAFLYRAALLGLDPKLPMPNGLDIWAPNKVLNIEWDNAGAVCLVSFGRGSWESTLLGMRVDR
jgi:hypothetical protein